MDRSGKRGIWARRIAAFERSGLSRRAWCVAQGVNVHTLDYWRYRLRASKGVRASKAVRSRSKALIPIVLKDAELTVRSGSGKVGVESSVGAPIEIALPGAILMRVPLSADAHWLATLLRGLDAC